ncbi:MAG: S9 family peptidase [Thermoanaerobaculia bacterium]|nr:S9 family peptidase [Thermoanaerobaculia bacterium]
MTAAAIRFVVVCGVGLLAMWLLACATAASRMDRSATTEGLEALWLRGGEFHLRAYAQGVPETGTAVLHVYLEGDGRPWVAGGTRVARDPHGEHHLAFDLMRLDPSPSLYLKRPCYQERGGVRSAVCVPLLWTHQRYSETVVAAMESALRTFLAEHPADRLALHGYSGGGVLAMLLAPRFSETWRVVTVAANLDVAAWADLHGYTPLAGSLDPALQTPLPERIGQLHLVGELDRNVPPALVRSATESQHSAEVRVVEGFDHTCCWRDLWPQILNREPTPDGP